MKILTLNCQRGYQPGLGEFLRKTLESGEYDFILLQEFAKEVPSYVRGVGPYRLLEVHNAEVSAVAQTCIVYKNSIELLESNYLFFPRVEGKTMLVGSIHLHSGFALRARAAQLRAFKHQVLSLRKNNEPVLFGGDCNFGYPGEHALARYTLAPEFVQATRGIGGTIDSRYVENVAHLPNRIAALFTRLGLHITMSMDHVFVDAATAQKSKITCRILPDRVSDHSPVEVEIAAPRDILGA